MGAQMRIPAVAIVLLLMVGCDETRPQNSRPGTTEPTSVPTTAMPSTDPDQPAAASAKIVCDGETTIVRTPVVATSLHGVIFTVAVPAGSDLGFTVLEAGQGANAEEGRFVWVVPPGTTHVLCSTHHDDPGDRSLYETLTVVDRLGFYKDPELGCADGSGYGMSDGPAAPGTPKDQALDRLTGLRPDDVVERAGYPRSWWEATVRVVRDGTVVANLGFEHARDGWVFNAFQSCRGSGLTA
jgi:hypothetical protein